MNPASDLFRPQEGFLIGAHHGLELSDVDRVCALLVEPPVCCGSEGLRAFRCRGLQGLRVRVLRALNLSAEKKESLQPLTPQRYKP